MRTWKVMLAVSVLVHIKAPDDWPEDAIRMLARDSISLWPPGDECTVALEVEDVVIDDVVEICVRES